MFLKIASNVFREFCYVLYWKSGNIVYVGVRRQSFNLFAFSKKFRFSGNGDTANCQMMTLLCSMNWCRKLLFV